ncbi:MAG TPA: DUF5335 family protein [Crenalkalicoccus sp.]|nr:DUF5335 family protein [Crenalkalicoccus sp.]
MRTRSLEKSSWKSYSEWISKLLAGRRAEIEVSALGIGSQIQAEWVPLLGLVYDPKDDLFEVALEGLDHLIRRPLVFNVLDGPRGLESFEIIDGEGRSHTVNLRDPLDLPPPDQG